jgi:YD repeat-containing protein
VDTSELGYINNGSLVITSNARDADASFAKTGMLEKITYPTDGYSLFDYEAHSYSKAFKRQDSYMMVNENGVCGGLRLKSISNYNSASELSGIRTFEYTDGTNSSGVLLHFPVYYAEYSAYTVGGISENNIRYYSSGINSYASTHIEYSRVTENHIDNSQVVYEFSNSVLSTDYADGVYVTEVVDEPFSTYGIWTITNSSLVDLTAPITSKQADRGKLLSKRVYSAGSMSTPVHTETNTYNYGNNLAMDYLPAYFIRKIGYYIQYIDNYKQTGRIVSELRNGTTVTRGEKYNYNSYGQVVRIAIRDSKGDSLVTKYQYVWDLNPSQITPSSVYRFMIDHNITSQPLSEMVYIKKGGTGSETLILGKRYTYINPVTANKAIVRLSKVELYDNTTAGWYTELEYSSFDSKGNILESIDRSGIYTSYVWGYNGLYLVAKVENIGLTTLKSLVSGLSGISETPLTGGIVSGIQSTLRSSSPNSLATLYDYIPFVGLSKVTDPAGKITTYDYNLSGKLKSVKDSKNLPQNTIFYSPDNKL